jgi:hypothetical protein
MKLVEAGMAAGRAEIMNHDEGEARNKALY